MTTKTADAAKADDAAPVLSPQAGRETAVLAVAFLAGGVLMAMEIVGGRIVAAKFGSHVFVWGGLIGVFMGALSLGYFLGGMVADKFPRFRTLGATMLLAGLSVLLVPAVADPFCSFVSSILFTGNAKLAIQWNPTVAIVLIFTVPSLLLGSISPMAIRLLARELESMGKVTARVYALNAMGSIGGTLLTAFILMGYMGNTAILLSCGIFFGACGIALLAGRRLVSQPVKPHEVA